MLKIKKMFRKTHWLTKFVIKYGVICATILLLTAAAVARMNEPLSLSMGSVSVYMFAEVIIFGLLIDVIAKRTGIDSDDGDDKEEKQ